MERKPGGYRKPSVVNRVLSIISDQNHKEWFRCIWSGVTGASTRNHPAPFPEEVAERLVRMFSFAGDVVLDPFMGTGTTTVAAARWGRNSIGVEIDPHYLGLAQKRIRKSTDSLCLALKSAPNQYRRSSRVNYSDKVADAVAHFWRTRQKQDKSQGSTTGVRDAGGRSAVTGGAQLNGFINLLASILNDAGLQEHEIHTQQTVLPGYFRPTKEWDLVVVAEKHLLATIEFKSHVGPSFGNNFNNRVEEALGSATDILTAYRQGAFKPSKKPWLGWLMLLEDAQASRRPIRRVVEPHFDVFPELKEASYAKRYELFCERLVREQLYDSACLLLSDRKEGLNGHYCELNPEIGFRNFAVSLSAHAHAFVKMREG